MKRSLSFAATCRLAANICAILTAFASFRLYNIYLTKELYGIVLVGMQFLSYLPLLGSGFGMVLGQRILADQDPATALATSRFNQVLQNYLLLIILLLGFMLMAGYSQMPTSRSMGLPLPLFFAIGVAGVANFYLGGQMGLLVIYGGQQVYSIILQGIWSLLALVILWGCFVLGWGVWAMPVSTALSALLLVLVVWVLLQPRMKGLPILAWRRESDFWPKLRAIWAPSLAWIESQVSIMLQFTLDIILMGMLFGPGAAAVYGIISRITGMSRQIIQSLGDAAWPRLTMEPDLERRAALMRKVDRLNAWITGSWYGAMAATVQPFLGWLMKEDWVAGPLLIGLVLARNMIVSLSSPHGYGLLSAGRFKELARATQREVFLCALFIFVFGHFFGMIGIALATLVATAGGSLWYMTFLYFKPSPHQHWFRELVAVYGRGVVSAGLSFAVASVFWWGEKFLLGAPGWMAIPAGGIGLGVGMIVALAFGMFQSAGHTRPYGQYLKLPTNW